MAARVGGSRGDDFSRGRLWPFGLWATGADVQSPATPPTRTIRTAVLVTFSLLDGTTFSGRMQSFDPRAPDHRVETFGHAPGEPTGLRLLAVERLAWVGFHRDPSVARASNDGAPVYILRLHGNGVLRMAIGADGEVDRAPGFYARPVERDSVFDRVFVFHHAVASRELDERLGEVLVRNGAISEEALARGLRAQAEGVPLPLGSILVEQRSLTQADIDAALALQRRKRLRIGELLVETGLCSPEDITRGLEAQKRRKGKRLGEVLIELGTITEADLALTLAEKFEMTFVDLEQLTLDPAAVRAVPREILERYGVLPIAVDVSGVTLALSDPLSTDAVDTLRVLTRKPVREVIATPTQLQRFLHAALVSLDHGDDEMEKTLAQLRVEAEQDAVAEARRVGVEEAADSAVIRLVNQIIAEAYKRGVSDIHIEPNGEERPVLVRFRHDGECSTWQSVPSTARSAIVSRLKVMASLDISERRKPQDGKIRHRFHDKIIELRLATIPTVNGNEDAVLRILASSRPVPLTKLGLSARNHRELDALIHSPHGLLLCVGPTGSGKTTTLHSMLGAINTPDTKIWTAEDPVEITQPGLRQVQVQPRIGLTFAAAMRSFLRADPDVIMVGEMRDQETAETAVEASLTGHLVLSTLHTNSAPETVTRLVDMGLEPFSFADALLGVLAQRLVRALCPACAQCYEPNATERADLAKALGDDHPRRVEVCEGMVLRQNVGCPACGTTGYKGRLAVHELMVNDDTLRRAIQLRAPAHELRVLARATGMTTLLQDGAERVLDGRTDLRQVLAVCSR